MAELNQQGQNTPPKKKRARWKRILKRFILGVVLFWIALLAAIQIPAVQQYLISKVTERINEETGLTTKADRFQLKFFSEIVLEGVYIGESPTDTALYAGTLEIGFVNPIYTYFKDGNWVIKKISLSDSKVQWLRRPGESESNFDRILQKINPAQDTSSVQSPEEQKEGLPFVIDLKTVQLAELMFSKKDSVSGSNEQYSISSGRIIPRELNFEDQRFIFDQIRINHPQVKFSKYDGSYIDLGETESVDEVEPPDPSSPPLRLKIKDLSLQNGTFQLDNYSKSPVKTSASDVLDWDHLDIRNVHLAASDFIMQDWNFDACLEKLALQSSSGFEINQLASSYLHVDPEIVDLEDVELRTPESQVNADIELHYSEFPDFKEFVDSVQIHFRSRGASVAIRDILQFAPELNTNQFFRESINQKIHLHGNINGPVNRLNGQDVSLHLGRYSFVEGNFSSRNLSEGESAFIDFQIRRSHSSMNDLKRILPGFSPPPNFSKLKEMQFSGRYKGTFRKFLASGFLQTNIGSARLKMNMDVSEGNESATYDGDLELRNFDLGAWTENPDLGKLNVDIFVKEGHGLNMENLDARIEAIVSGLSYKDYVFNNFEMDGRFDQTKFSGDFRIEDQYMDLQFIGSVDLQDELPIIDLDARVQNINLGALELTQKDLQLSGEMKLKISNYNLDQLAGAIIVDDLLLTENDTTQYEISRLTAFSRKIPSGGREIFVQSPLVSGEIKGSYKISEIIPSFIQKARQQEEDFADFLGLEKDSISLSKKNFTLDLEINDTENWLQLIRPNWDPIKDSYLQLDWYDQSDSIHLEGYTPHFAMGSHSFDGGYIYLDHQQGMTNFVASVDSAVIMETYQVRDFSLTGDLVSDTLFWTLNTADFGREVDRFNLEAKTFMADSNLAFQISNRFLEIFYDEWYIHPKNIVQINKDFIRIANFEMAQEDRKIDVESINDEGIALAIENIDLEELNRIWSNDQLYFKGIFSASLSKPNIFQKSALQGKVNIDSLQINGDDYGTLDIVASSELEDSPLRVDGGIIHPDKNLSFQGYLFAQNTGRTEDFYDVDLKFDTYPLHILSYFLEESVTDLQGNLSGQFQLKGKADQPILEGEGLIKDGAVTVNFLGIRLFIEDQIIRSKENMIDATGVTIKDIYGNEARLTGGLTHDYFTELGLDFQMQSDKFLLLNTDEDDGQMYYGHCMGKAVVQMQGPLSGPSIDIQAENRENTRFYLRTDFVEEEVNAGFFRFENFSDTSRKEVKAIDPPKGVDFSLDLIANNQAEVQIIIDKRTGDIIKGRGKGNIQFNLDPNGDISMFGDYEISRGQYLFTSQVVIQKPFSVAPGSTIRWTGDPMEAIIDIRAQYTVSTSPYFLVQDMVTQANQIEEFKTNTEVILILHLSGMLYAPQLDFELEFPNLSGSQKSIVDNKLALLESDPNEMYKQAGALIVLNTFVPTTAASSQDLGVAAGVNTLSEFVSSQFSNVLSGLLKSAVEGVEFIDEIDFDLGYNVGTDDVFENKGLGISTGEFQFSTSARLFDRVELDVGTNYGVGNTASLGANESGTYLTGNFALQYALTEDRRLVLRVYSATDQVLEGRRFRSGVGIRYQQEFDSFEGFFKSFKEAASKIKAGKGRKTSPTGAEEN